MAETHQKRQHDGDDDGHPERDNELKRQRPCNSILSLPEAEEEQPPSSNDLSAMFSTIEQEVSSSSTSCGGEESTYFDDFNFLPSLSPEKEGDNADAANLDDGGAISVMRHLLEASDDELGIPNRENETGYENPGLNLPFEFSDHVFWEFCDETANDCSVLPLDLFP